MQNISWTTHSFRLPHLRFATTQFFSTWLDFLLQSLLVWWYKNGWTNCWTRERDPNSFYRRAGDIRFRCNRTTHLFFFANRTRNYRSASVHEHLQCSSSGMDGFLQPFPSPPQPVGSKSGERDNSPIMIRLFLLALCFFLFISRLSFSVCCRFQHHRFASQHRSTWRPLVIDGMQRVPIRFTRNHRNNSISVL